MDDTEEKITNLLESWEFAEKHHKGQMYGSKPYKFHLKNVTDIALDCDYTDESILISCVLHDVIVDTDVTYEDVKNKFGEEVAEIVYCVTDELGRNRKERKSKTYKKIYDNPKAIVVKLCDRVSNIIQSMSSDNYNVKLMQMYLVEHEDFCKGIWNEDSLDLTSTIWSKYYRVIDNLLSKLIILNEKNKDGNIV